MELTNLDITKIPSHEYLHTILSYLQKQNILSDKCIAQIKLDLVTILQENIRKFTGGDSSVSKERAQSLMDSIMYSISIFLKQKPVAIVIELLQTRSLISTYHQGQSFLQQLLVEIDVEIADLQCMLLSIDNDVYNDTLKHGLSSFTKAYNPDYVAQDCVLTLDYPTYLSISNQVGIELFCTYITYLKMEHTFYTYFSVDSIKTILQHYHHNYQFLIFNITELLWKQVLLKAWLGLPNLHLISIIELKQLYILLQPKTKEEIYQELQALYYEVCATLGVNTINCIEYFGKGLKSIALQIYYGVKHQTLDKELSIQKNE